MRAAFGFITLFVMLGIVLPASAQVVPGTGTRVWHDNFEDEEWEYIANHPKSSHEQDNNVRLPGGISKNRLWAESSKRGHPDYIRRIETPCDGIQGSKGSMVMMTLESLIPNRKSYELGQDDFICRVPGSYSASSYPSATVRVYLPEFEKWEKNSAAASFGFRTTVTGSRPGKKKTGFFSFGGGTEREQSWPGIFIEHRSPADNKNLEKDEAQWVIRGSNSGDFRGPMITKNGWWTLGMSFSPDGKCHYYISEGVDNLTQADRIASTFPYSYKVEEVSGMFFNIFNKDDGKSWSTPWVIDDPAFYVGRGNVASRSR
ncbi:MAG: hypothetical protein ACKVH8_18895 [Pirellulales bacterium]